MSLSVAGIGASYGRIEVLHDLTVHVEPGEIVAVIGANGAGKTTLLGVAAGLVRATRGRVTVSGVDTTRWAAERVAGAGLALVPENRLVFPGLSVADNLVLGAWLRRRDRSGVATDRERVLTLFPKLRSRLAQPAGTLSGGEQQMLAIGRGLMAAPRVLLLDEPSLGVAPMLVAEIFAALAGLRGEGLSVLLVEQNARAALKISDRAYVLDRGRVALSGPPAELLDDERVKAAYLGQGYAEVPAEALPDASTTVASGD